MSEATNTFEAVLEDIKKTSEETIGIISDRFDFSLESIGILDGLVDELNFDDDEDDIKFMNFVGYIGAYIGEVVRKNGFGDWVSSATEPEYKTDNPAIVKTATSIFDPFNWALKRMRNGSEDNLLLKFNVMVLNDHTLPNEFSNLSKETSITPKKKKGFWGRLFELP